MSAHQRIRSPMEASRGNRNPKGETLLRVLRILAFATPVVALRAFLAYQQGIGWTPLDCEFTRTWEDCNWDWLNPLLWGPWPHRSADYPNGLGLIARALWWLFIGILVGTVIDWGLRRLKFRRRRLTPVD